MLQYNIRSETNNDIESIRLLTKQAFKDAPHSDGNEYQIVDKLRANNALTLSLVLIVDSKIIGHCAFSPVSTKNTTDGWTGLGPVSIAPDFQSRGLGTELIRHGLNQIKEIGIKGCVVLGDPNYYQRFGFTNNSSVTFEGVPAEYFMVMSFDGSMINGSVSYDPAFYP